MAVVTASVATAAVGAGSAIAQSKAAKKATKAQTEAADANLAQQKAIYDQNRADLAPTRIIGDQARNEMAYQLGLQGYQPEQNRGSFVGPVSTGPGYRVGDGAQRLPYLGDGGLESQEPDIQPYVPFPEDLEPETLEQRSRYGAFETTPGYQFRFDEGQRSLAAAAAAGGYRGSGRQIKEAIRYGQNFASNEYGNYYNRLASLANAGQTATGQTVSAANQHAVNTGNIITNTGEARAAGAAAQGNAITGGLAAVGSGINFYAANQPSGGATGITGAATGAAGAGAASNVYRLNGGT